MNPWSQLADDAIAAFDAIDDGLQNAFTYAYAASAVATRQTWFNAQTLIDKARALAIRDPDGTLRGWSTTATGTTVWTVTIADHILPVLLESHLYGGDATQAEIIEAAHLIMAAPRNSITPDGWGISYLAASASPINIYNCTAAAAGTLRAIHQAEIFIPDANGAGATTLAAQFGRSVTDNYQRGTAVAHNWVYSSADPTPTDADHGSLLIESCQQIAPAVATHALDWLIATNYGTQPNAALGHLRAGAYALDRVDMWLTEARDYLAATTTAQRRAQVARWAARIGQLQETAG